ncbi:MAG: A/G-specific adenine glycosylase [bacterium]
MANLETNTSSRPQCLRTPPPLRRRIRAKLLRWYDAEKRDLPWRGETDPYRIWVSEVMLQQTRAETVLDRYSRFLSRFRTIRSLADAPLEAVLAEWQGLGYYSRARNLHRAARLITESRQGRLPRDRSSLSRLPGFGPYMAGAVASIAFGERAAAVDGNVVRVLSRLLDFEDPADSPAGKRVLEEEAEALVSASRPGDFNQAMMDLGAVVCLPKIPRCRECPLKQECQSLAAGTAALRPVKTKKKPPKNVTVFQLWAKRRRALRLVRREENGLFGGMWELPGWMEDGHQERPDRKTLLKLCRNVLGPGWRVDGEIARLSRTLTHRKILFVVLRAAAPKGKLALSRSVGEAIWAKEDELAALPISTAQRAAIKAAREALDSPQEKLFTG